MTDAQRIALGDLWCRMDVDTRPEYTRAMEVWVRFIYNDAPSGCHGSREIVKSWIERGGLVGITKADEDASEAESEVETETNNEGSVA